MATETLRPNANGTDNEFPTQFPGVDNHFDKVDEASQDGDDTYVESSSAVNGAGATGRLSIRENGVTTESGNKDIGAAYGSKFQQWTTRPSDSAAFTWADIADLEIGWYSTLQGERELFNVSAPSGSGTINSITVYAIVKYVYSDPNIVTRVTQSYVVVDYTLSFIDTAEKRRSVSGIMIPLMPGVTPNAGKDSEWRQQVGWSYSGIPATTPSVFTPIVMIF